MSANTLPAQQASAVLSRDLSDFVIELSIALHKHAMYPDDHPLLKAAQADVVRRLDSLMRERQSLALGVARDQLIIEGLATDSRNPLLHGLAQHLHRHGVGAVKFLAGIRGDEIEAVLRALAADADAEAAAGQPDGAGERRDWQHVRLLPLTYGQLELVDETGSDPPAGGLPRRTAQLWLDLARSALQAEAGDDRPPTDPRVVAKAINAHEREQAYDQVIIGYLLQIADQLSTGDGAESALLRRRVSELVGALEPEHLRRLLALGGDVAQRRRFLLDASQGMAVDAVLTLVEAAADASHQVISESLLRLFAKLAVHAERGMPAVRPEAEVALRDQIQQLVSGWTLPDPNSQRYGVMLEHMALKGPLFVAADDSVHRCERERLVQMSLEVGCVGTVLEEALDGMVDRGELGVLVEMLDRAPPGSEAAAALEQRVLTPDQLRRLLEAHHSDSGEVEWMVPRLGSRAADPLLDTLAAADSRAQRRRILDLLCSIGPEIGPAIVARLPGAPWYFQRNLLSLLDRLSLYPEGFTATPFAVHADARVRREAVRLLVKQAAERDAAICAALRDSDEQVVRLALGAALEQCPDDALEIIVERLTARAFDPDLELLAIRVVGSVRVPAAIDCLIDCAAMGRRWLRGRRPDPRTPRLIAALSCLVANWATEPRVAAILARAARHPDPAVRAVASSGQSGL
ncbi:MAG TPA: hypothetical protein VIQ60_07895 [Gemmatimonadaceae bacterium]